MLTKWDNLASKYILTSNSSLPMTSDIGLIPASKIAFKKASDSPKACQSACMALYTCMSWRHEEAETNKCALDDVVRLGRETDPLLQWEKEKNVTSGWALERIESDLAKEKC